MAQKKLNITITTYNRADRVENAIKSALDQVYDNYTVTVIDDCSTDDTQERVSKYFNDPRFCYIKLGKNVGTYQARNLAVLVNDYEAITFLDSDDIIDRMKLLLQSRALFIRRIFDENEIQGMDFGIDDPQNMVQIATSAVNFISPDGHVSHIGSITSLMDMMVPNVSLPNRHSISFTHVTPSLVNKSVYRELGGYMPARVSGDVEFKDRAVCYGVNYFYIHQALVTMINGADSLSVNKETDSKSKIREEVTRVNQERLKGMRVTKDKQEFRDKYQVPLTLEEMEIEFISNPALLTINKEIPATEATLNKIQAEMQKFIH